MFQQKIRIQIPVWSHKGAENTMIKYVSVGNPFSLESKTLKRRKVFFLFSLSSLFLGNTSIAAQCDSFILALLQGACSQETRLGLLANWDDLTAEICPGGEGPLEKKKKKLK